MSGPMGTDELWAIGALGVAFLALLVIAYILRRSNRARSALDVEDAGFLASISRHASDTESSVSKAAAE